MALLQDTMQDVRYGLRVLLKNPGFTAATILTLALGIGVNTAIFSLVYGVLFRPLPYTSGRQLVVLHQKSGQAGEGAVLFSPPEFFDYRDKNHTLDAVVEHHTMFFLLLGKDTAERVQTAVVSPNFFDVLGVKALMGRTFVPTDDTQQSNAVLVLSYNYWRSRRGGDPNIVGKIFEMNSRPHTVIGVLPPIPEYPVASDVYMPVIQCPFRSAPSTITSRETRLMNAFGRLKPGVTIEQARADLSTIARQLEMSYPASYPKSYGYSITALSLQDELTARARPTFLVLLAAAGFVLLIACANVANLLLARLLKVERELALRTALGASRGRVVRQLLTESVLLSLVGGGLGLILAPAVLTLLVTFAAGFTTRASEVAIDAPVLAFTLGVSLLTGLLFGLAPAFSSGQNAAEALKQGTGRNTSNRSRQRLRAALVIAQVAVSFMLLIGAGLMIRSFLRLQQVDPGFNPEQVLTLRASPDFTRISQPQQYRDLCNNMLRRVAAVAGVDSVSLASSFPFNPDGIANGPNLNSFEIEGHNSKGDLAPQVDIINAGPDYFRTIRQGLVAGRIFTEHDNDKAPLVGVINQSMAKHRWKGDDPVGKRVTFDHGKTWIRIVGIVHDVREYGSNHPADDELYTPVAQNVFVDRLVLRTKAEPMTVASSVRAALHDLDPQLAVDSIETIQNYRDASLSSSRVTTILLGIFAGLAVLISAFGIAAVMALAVGQRKKEIGVRMALGASPGSVVGMMVREGLILAAVGAAVGIAGALALTKLLTALLFETSASDALTYAGVSVLFLAVSALACFIPARQATSIDPLMALRQE